MTKHPTRGAAVKKPVNGAPMPERQLQELVRRTALAFGYCFYHPWMSVKSAPGFPDCTLTKAGRLIFAELKTERGTLSVHQEVWLDTLRLVPGVEVYCWRPCDWLDGTIERVLRGEEG